MENVILIRTSTSDQGTEGILIYPQSSCFMLEPPWRDNRSNVSCIPKGEYDVNIVKSPKYGLVYNIKDVPNRSHILQHSGNIAGDVEKGFKTNSYGCQLFGRYRGYLYGQIAVLCSKLELIKFMKLMEYKPYYLLIREEF